MKSSEVAELVRQLTSVDIATADVERCTKVLHGLSRVVAWAEARKIGVARQLAALAVESPEISPEHVVATATRVSLGQAMEPFKRATTIEALPEFGEALVDGLVSAAHVDVVASAFAKLDDDGQRRFATRGEFLADVARRTTPGEFARTVRAEVLRTQRGDGLERLRRQQQATYLKTWVDQASGMWCLHGEFDPETGARLHNR